MLACTKPNYCIVELQEPHPYIAPAPESPGFLRSCFIGSCGLGRVQPSCDFGECHFHDVLLGEMRSVLRISGKGGKNRRRGKNENESDKRELIFKEDGQEYAQVVKMLGNGRLEATCFDGVSRLCHIRGKLRKKVRGEVLHPKQDVWYNIHIRFCGLWKCRVGTIE